MTGAWPPEQQRRALSIPPITSLPDGGHSQVRVQGWDCRVPDGPPCPVASRLLPFKTSFLFPVASMDSSSTISLFPLELNSVPEPNTWRSISRPGAHPRQVLAGQLSLRNVESDRGWAEVQLFSTGDLVLALLSIRGDAGVQVSFLAGGPAWCSGPCA